MQTNRINLIEETMAELETQSKKQKLGADEIAEKEKDIEVGF